MLPLNQFLNFIQQHRLFSGSDAVLLAVSGGRDSVLLAHLFNAANFTFGIAHCNFGLRGQESDDDETFVRDLAEDIQKPFYSTRFNTREYAAVHKVSIQMAARELRYSWLEELRQKENFRYIALAHHASDTTETVLLNLVRGTGISGLHGILPKRDKLIRPLLFLTREEIDEVVEQEKLSYREDSSNSSTKYARNKIRLEVIPTLKELNPLLDETFKENARRFLELEAFLDRQVEQLRQELFIPQRDGKTLIPLPALRQLEPKNLLLYHLFKPYGFSESVLRDFSEGWKGQPGKKFLSATHQLLIDREKAYLMKSQDTAQEVTLVHKDEAALRHPQFSLIYHCKSADKISLSKNPHIAMLDADLLQFPLKLRYWNRGDYFYPFGMKGKKKLSDFFIGQKVALSDKNTIPILENGNGDIVWIVGWRIDDRYKITPKTRKVYIFEKHKPYGN
ncbi:tRNA lysidine(34) synthetase TilS [Pedobacter sp. SYSU D00535]|uniref:tRNA lysidine(34) synthetase TilS n=1 Tax=Pedobacter sp. SYSU D00535 TaxID=2810308 RepID=UPI001A962CE6|nr:tRNA lysidine(34) synthetase TilS [Pedobacter sp. SYSU D00535]